MDDWITRYEIECAQLMRIYKVTRIIIQYRLDQINRKKMEKEEYTQDMIEQIIYNVIGYSQQNGDLLCKYNDEFYLSYFDRLKIDEAVKKVTIHTKELQIAEFVRLFLSVIEHKCDETLFLAISLIQLYRKIKEDTNNDKGVKFSDFTSFLCNKISQGDPDLVVPMREIALERVVPDTSKIRDIDINPPPILNKVEIERPKITKDKTKKDKKLDEKKPLAKFIYSPSLNSIITLGRLSSSITLYDPRDLHVQHKIVPSTCKIMAKDVAILSIAFSQKDQRIGCIINNIGIAFWEASDNFSTEKILNVAKSDYDPKSCGDKIYYLNLFQKWVTTDKDTIYFWDLKQQQVTQTITKPHATSIHDICEVTHLRSLLVSYNIQADHGRPKQKLQHSPHKSDKHEEKMLILYDKDGKQKSKLLLDNPGCHSLCYNATTQLVICLGYQSNICVYEIDSKTHDINLITELQAHISILTCVSNIGDTSMIVSGDDIGYLKLWDLNYMRCLQSIKIAKNLAQLSCFNNMLLYADSRINMIPIDATLDSKYKLGNSIIKEQANNSNNSAEESYGIYEFFRKDSQSLWIITRKQAREVDINSGRIKNILVLCNAEEDISAAIELNNGFLIGTSKGEMSKFAFDGERKWRINAHEGQIHCIKMDSQNNMILTIGVDNNLFIWPEKSLPDEQQPRKRISFGQTDINLLQICPFANLILLSSTRDTKITLWNYDSLKLAYKLQFDSTVTSFLIMPDKKLFLITTSEGELHLFNYLRKESKLKISRVGYLNINQVRIEKSLKNLAESSESQHDQEEIEQEQYITACKTDRKIYISRVAHCEDSNLILATTPKGLLYCFKPEDFPINPNYRREYEPTPMLKRPMKQSYEYEQLKGQFLKFPVSKMELLSENVHGKTCQLQALWYKKIHKDSIFYMNCVNLQKKYACTLCIDGYFKLTEISEEEGILVCSNKISFPLPVRWDIDAQNYCDLRNQIHEAIAIIDTIIKDFSYELTVKQQSNLNITSFMQKMIVGYYQVAKIQHNAQVMNDQFTQADVKQVCQKPITLKSLQAYKRLQAIKKHNDPNPFPSALSSKSSSQSSYHHYETSSVEKESIRNFLNPNYLPKLLNKNIIDTSLDLKKGPGYIDLVGKLDEIYSMFKDKKSDKENIKDKQNRIGNILTKHSRGPTTVGMTTSVNMDENASTIRKRGSMIKNQINNESFVKDKTVKQILSEINYKLQLHKKSKNKMKDSFVVNESS